MNDEKKERLDALKESVSFFSAARKGEIELWTCNELLLNLSKNFTPEDVTPMEISDLIFDKLVKLVYELKFRAILNLLFYVNLAHHILNTGPMPNPDRFSTFGFQSVSVLMGRGALVYCASSNAPDFLLAKVGTVTFRHFP